jgi:hypothetical protein
MRPLIVKRVLTVALTLALLGSALALVFEAGAQTGESDRRLSVGQAVTGTLDTDNFAQSYIFDASASDQATLTAITASDELTLALVLTDPDGNILARDGDLSTPQVATLSDVELPVNGTYSVSVLRGSGAEGDASGEFTLELSGNLNPPPEEVVEEDVAAPVSVPAGQTVFVTLEENGIEFTLEWSAAVDLNLEVRDPVGGAVFFDNPAVDSGGVYGGNINGTCEAATDEAPTETISWPEGVVPAGSYEILIHFVKACGVVGPQPFTLTASADGGEPTSINGIINPGQDYLARLTLDPNKNWSLFNGGVNAGFDVILEEAALPIQLGSSVVGNINNSNTKDAYTFDAASGETVSIEMNATSGSLDPLVILLNPNGQVIADNDDSPLLDTRNSYLEQVIPGDGTYTVLATRYGQIIGGTEGDYVLNVETVSSVVDTTDDADVATDTETETTDTTDTGETVATAGTLPEGSVEVQLNWVGSADVQLLVRDPNGAVVFDDSPTISSGGILEAVGNQNCVQATGDPVSYIYWPANRQPPVGVYEVEVWYQSDCDAPGAVTWDLSVSVGGIELFSEQQTVTLDEFYMVTFQVNNDGTSEVGPGGIFRMDDPDQGLDWTDQIDTAPLLDYVNFFEANGNITLDQRFEVYRFEGRAGDRVRISMVASGTQTLDPAVYLIDPDNIYLTHNDDIEPGVNRNSLIDTFQLQKDGIHYIIATHYGLQYGATVGSYTVTLTQLP